MSTPVSAQVVPTREQRKLKGGRNATHLSRIPTLDELPVNDHSSRRGEVVTYAGVSFGGQQPAAPAPTARGPIESLQFFADPSEPGQIFARVMIMEPGNPVAREAIITPPMAVAHTERKELDKTQALQDLVQRANFEVSRFFEGFGPIDNDLKLKAFREFVHDREDLDFLFSNLVEKGRNSELDLFDAYFAPGGAMSGVGVFVNTWL